MAHEFRIEREVVLPATPEQVFAAVTEGTAGWMFPTPAVNPADPDPANPVRTWDPPHHLAVRQDGPDGWFNALEHIIEAHDGGTAVVRYVHSGIMTDDWEAQYDGASKHTDFYLHSLGEYLDHFAGRPVTYIAADGPESSGAPGSFDRLPPALGISAAAAPGAPVALDIPGLDHIDAVIDYRNEWFLGLRSADALYRFYGRDSFGATVDAAHHLFGARTDGDRQQTAWQNWLDALYA
ncbi:SRPBCC domain-containing protein [Aldersonia sp. NBC_00410]|uniref:SRPBCC family protein n=1 Tax=Aldersonia sp. NBC_00410 TaxID=2975954 RepID=UPI00225AE9A7|nr:SRPBCC domain-containing protein [Aldersonia sp. NBC_00410]MCX5043504.1 SRPBCC domain-containing protein [Aldersonia sp. NBC_00410]